MPEQNFYVWFSDDGVRWYSTCLWSRLLADNIAECVREIGWKYVQVKEGSVDAAA